MEKHSLYENAKKKTFIEFLSSSQESNFIEYLVLLDSIKDVPIKDENHKREDHEVITEAHLVNKLFIHDNMKDIKNESMQNENQNLDEIFFLKNKYLYLYGEGAMFYLQASQTMKSDKLTLNELEERSLKDFLVKFYNEEVSILQHKVLVLVSLASANAKKEINVLKELVTDIPIKKIKLIPIDVSAPLIQLSVLNFNNIFCENDNVSIHPIIGDLWNLTDSSEEFEFNKCENVPKVFTLFGSTIGNYKEDELLSQIIQIMDVDDYLIIGFDLLPNDDPKISKNEIYELYNSLGNIQFMLNPLSYIPKYRGYLTSFDKYFKLKKDLSVIEKSKDGRKYNLITKIPYSICYAPQLDIPIGNKTMSISLAQSTKYHLESILEWIKDFKYPEKADDYFSFVFNEKEDVKNENKKCVLILKKIFTKTSETALNDGTEK